MKLLLPLMHLLSALFAVSSAFVIPANTPDGLYVHTPHKNGSHTHTSLSIAPHHGTVHRTPPSAKFIKSRDLHFPFTSTHCGNEAGIMYKLNQSDVIGAIKQFHKGCDSTLDLGGAAAGIDVYSRYGDAIVFMCNYGGKWCKNDEFDEAFNMIKRQCGDHSGQNTGESSFQ
jgi:hypothetical protein